MIIQINHQALTASNFDELRQLLSSAKQPVTLCWQAGELQQCGNLKLFNRF
ncbi:hypothetical protein HG263_18420 [Pseudoalteromonas sp. JBTF-M23]|uniref:Uncharacterized protein n=1 Tax=Pseudoalteromonas caenipelagi TaxID=2726988 RepID=A0A849VLC9_9GAMM|nr:hypothetical protein [Pseudoalteromonas caenipelagi]NOU52491.1 hypothetical protein [Pseudoalteromonas caenipelagi]